MKKNRFATKLVTDYVDELGSVPIAIATTNPACVAKAKRLAMQLDVPFTTIDDRRYPVALVVTPTRTEIRFNVAKSLAPVYVDFLTGKLAHRRRFGGQRTQLIAKAVGVATRSPISILDVTAGLGQDGFVLACLGAQVTMLERNAVVATLLKDGLRRARRADWFKKLKLRCVVTEAQDYLMSLSKLPDVIYLDPMYPQRNKSALVKKEMRLLRQLVGADEDAVTLLSLALQRAKRRVVVKRPRLASKISGPQPQVVFHGKSCRFDVYLIDQLTQ